MKKIETNVERYQYNNEYILEVWEENTEEDGLVWYFTLARGITGYKMDLFGLRADQTQANVPHVYTKEEAIELAEANVEDYIPNYEEELEMLCEEFWSEEEFWEAVEEFHDEFFAEQREV